MAIIIPASPTFAELRAALKALRRDIPRTSKSTERAIKPDNVTRAIRATLTAKRRVRVYSSAGFVPNSYKYRCLIQYVDGTRRDDGSWSFYVGWGGAQRSHGAGKLVVVQ